jgi:hypothetical protein
MTKLDKNNAYWGISWKLYLSEDRRMPVCTICSNNLSGRQTKFCSPECKNRDTNIRNQSYRCQQQRGRVRKLELVKAMGGRCGECGYRRNFSALEFHHIEAVQKTFQLDLRSLSNRRWNAITDESRKCKLLCSNCHKELHNPDCFMPES